MTGCFPERNEFGNKSDEACMCWLHTSDSLKNTAIKAALLISNFEVLRSDFHNNYNTSLRASSCKPFSSSLDNPMFTKLAT